MIRRWFQFPRRPRDVIEDDVTAELQFHLDARRDALMAQGLDRDEAEARTRREFGDLDDARRTLRRLDVTTEDRQRRRSFMQGFQQDVRHAFRALGLAPTFTVVALLTLGLGIGANTAIFSIVHAVVLTPLPFPEADRLYAVFSANRTTGQQRGDVSPVDLDDWRAARRKIAEMGGYLYEDGATGVDLTGRATPKRLSAVFITPGFFGTLGQHAEAGRLPREDELVRGGPDKVVVLTHGFWLREFGGAPTIVGSRLTLNSTPYDVIGVLPASFRFPADAVDVFVPYSTIPDSGIPRVRAVRVLSVVARARPDVTQRDVQTEMGAITGQLALQYPEDRPWDNATVIPLHEQVTGQVHDGLFVLWGAVACVLLIACVNVSSLQLARSSDRGRELAVRAALGAGRARIVRQLMTESLVLSMLGGALGVAMAAGFVPMCLALAAGQLPRAAEVQLNGVVLLFAGVVSVATAVLVGLIPAVRLTATALQDTLRQGGRSLVSSGSRRARTWLTVAEIALAMILVVGAGVMSRSFARLAGVDTGFDPNRLIAVQFTIDPDHHASSDDVRSSFASYYEQLIDAVRALPGVEAAGAIKDAPFRGNGEPVRFMIPGTSVPAGQDLPGAAALHVSSGYFAAIGARLIDGRDFTARDRVNAPFVVIVNSAFARTYFPGQRVVGQHLLSGNAKVEIVGLVNDIRQVSMAQPAGPTIYIHNLQNTRVKTTLVARTHGDPSALANRIRQAIWAINPKQTITEIFTFDESVKRSLSTARLLTAVLGGFGGLGLMLGVLGVYGLLAQLAHQRRREIGVRMALGARPADIRTLFLRHGVRLSATGAAIGLAGALALGRLLTTVLYQTSPTDPVSLAAAAAALLAAGALASWLPALRAARLDPAQTLRAE